MPLDPEVLKRSQYFTPPSTEHPHSSRTHYFDWQEYHRPLLRMHHAHLHDWGIASGLAVSVTADGIGVEVQPGVAIDGVGELITLSFGGQADISLVQPGEAGQQISAPFRLTTAGLTNTQRYLTIQFAERLRFGEGSGGKQEQTPWLRLQPTVGDEAYVDDGAAIILAVVTVDGAGGVTLKATDPTLSYGRRILSTMSGVIRLYRPSLAVEDRKGMLAAQIEPKPTGGLCFNVPGETDGMLLARQGGGRFALLTVQAEQSEYEGNLQVQGQLQVNGNGIFHSRVGIGVATPAAGLEINKGTTNELALLVSSSGPGWGSGLQWQNTAPNAKTYGIYSGADGNWHFADQDNRVDRLLINKEGNIGIGTNGPTHRFHVLAPDAVGLFESTGGQAYLRLSTNEGINNRVEITNRPGGRLSLWVAGGGDVFNITRSGLIGMGLTEPRTPLHVWGRIATGLDFQSAGAITFYPPDGFAWFHIDNGPAGGRPIGRLRISHGGNPGDAELISILQNGTVGIGVTNPAVKLHVVGNRIRLTKPGVPSHYLDLRADGSALDLESSVDLYLNNNNVPIYYRTLKQISSRAFKENIVELSTEDALAILRGLTAVQFNYKDDVRKEHHLGFIAEDVPAAIASLADKSISPMSIIAVLCRVVRNQQQMIATWQAKVDQ